MSDQPAEKLLGTYLKDRRAKLDPAAFGFPAERRRTPGLRREEVAQRAHISTTWYTWLEQGRGGAPSSDVLDRVARALMLTDVEREHIFLLGLGRPPEARYQKNDGVTPRLQRVLDALDPSPAFIKTATWDVIAWNRAAAVMLMESMARLVVGAFRLDSARAGAAEDVEALVNELSRRSPDFEAMWRENDVPAASSDGIKHMEHPAFGSISLEYSSFAVDGRPDLILAVYNPATLADAGRIASMLERSKP